MVNAVNNRSFLKPKKKQVSFQGIQVEIPRNRLEDSLNSISIVCGRVCPSSFQLSQYTPGNGYGLITLGLSEKIGKLAEKVSSLAETFRQSESVKKHIEKGDLPEGRMQILIENQFRQSPHTGEVREGLLGVIKEFKPSLVWHFDGSLNSKRFEDLKQIARKGSPAYREFDGFNGMEKTLSFHV